jgi:hypothetical protein
MPRFQYYRIAATALVLMATAPAGTPTWAQSRDNLPDTTQETEQQAPQEAPQEATKEKPKDAAGKPPKPFGGGSPLDVIMNTKFWEAAPEPKDFVKQNRQNVDELKYQPTIGNDPERPKTRSKDELTSLRSEMEEAATHNTDAVSGKKPPKPALAAQKAKPPRVPAKPHAPDKAHEPDKPN